MYSKFIFFVNLIRLNFLFMACPPRTIRIYVHNTVQFDFTMDVSYSQHFFQFKPLTLLGLTIKI